MQINKPIHRWQLSFEGEWVTSVAFLGDARRIAAGNRAGQIYVWELPANPPRPGQEEARGEKKGRVRGRQRRWRGGKNIRDSRGIQEVRPKNTT